MAQQSASSIARSVPGTMDESLPAHYVLEQSPRRARTKFNDAVVADSTSVRLLFETGRIPVYYFPKDDVDSSLLHANGEVAQDEVKGETRFFDVRVGDRTARNAAWICSGIKEIGPDLSGLVAFEWKRMDAWFEEDEEVFVHPRDPYTRVDILQSSRHIEVTIDGVKVADSTRPMMLFETGLPTRYYLPEQDVRMELLESSINHTSCPYKGTADYWSVRTGSRLARDIVWSYPTPIAAASKIAGLFCFYNEKVDLEVDGILQERPLNKWS